MVLAKFAVPPPSKGGSRRDERRDYYEIFESHEFLHL